METREKFSMYAKIFRGRSCQSKQNVLNVGETFSSTAKPFNVGEISAEWENYFDKKQKFYNR